MRGVGKEKVEVWGTFRGNEWSNKGEVMKVVRFDGGEVQVFEGRCLGGKEYFLERVGCKLFTIQYLHS